MCTHEEMRKQMYGFKATLEDLYQALVQYAFPARRTKQRKKNVSTRVSLYL